MALNDSNGERVGMNQSTYLSWARLTSSWCCKLEACSSASSSCSRMASNWLLCLNLDSSSIEIVCCSLGDSDVKIKQSIYSNNTLALIRVWENFILCILPIGVYPGFHLLFFQLSLLSLKTSYLVLWSANLDFSQSKCVSFSAIHSSVLRTKTNFETPCYFVDHNISIFD